ncbi:MAG TPA: ShlB/FhaC/HecB family hemolysin secretion/activation protein [Noviherbaspirillum sp.]
MPVLFKKSIIAAVIVAFWASDALAQPISDAELTRRQAQQQEQAQSKAANVADIFTRTAEKGGHAFVLPEEAPCFTIREIEWRGTQALAWIEAEGAVIAGKCVGAKGLRAFQDHLTRKFIERGYITSRVVVPEQNLAAGRLALQVVPGVIGKIRDQGEPVGMQRMVLPQGEGELLNQRDLDQALENIRRLAAQQEVAFDLTPGAQPGETDIVIKHPAAKRWRALFTLDDSGAESTGKYQVGAVLTVDSPLHLYDALTVTLNRNANFQNAKLGTHSSSLNWSVPFGYWSMLLAANESTYKQTVAGFSGDIVYGGHSYGMEAGLGYTLYRTSSAKGGILLKLNRKVSRSTIDDTEIDVQYRNVVGYDTSYTHRQYLGNSTLDLALGVRGSLPNQSGAPGLIVGAPDWDGRYQIRTANLSLSVPFELAGQNFRYQTSLRTQHATTLLPVFEFFSIGNRYTVRGFDGASTLAAENGWLLRNDFVWLPGRSSHELFLALDTGHVSGPTASTLLGTSLTGMALGLRGRTGSINYEITIGRPLGKPDGFTTKQPTMTASLGAEF